MLVSTLQLLLHLTFVFSVASDKIGRVTFRKKARLI